MLLVCMKLLRETRTLLDSSSMGPAFTLSLLIMDLDKLSLLCFAQVTPHCWKDGRRGYSASSFVHVLHKKREE